MNNLFRDISTPEKYGELVAEVARCADRTGESTTTTAAVAVADIRRVGDTTTFVLGNGLRDMDPDAEYAPDRASPLDVLASSPHRLPAVAVDNMVTGAIAVLAADADKHMTQRGSR